ncbi:MAG: hypothetical protein SPM02_00845 [Bacteroidales bacterium]|nr:hypothetical protein [Bacteroidales bacterium]
METNKLTAKDLMVGDYVYSTFSNKPCKVQAIELTEHGYGSVRVTGVDGVKDIVSVSPIPLTPEILEQNGFVKHRDIFYRFAVHIDEFNGFMFTLGIDFDGVFCLQSNRFVRYAYIHELQHAMRLCGINDKEIVL